MIKISHPTKEVKGIVTLPASKSLSNRMLIIQALSDLPVELYNLSEAEDTKVLKRILETKPLVADVGDAGTAMRFLLAYYATQPTQVSLTGSTRMQQRPIGPLVDALRSMGAEINYLEKEGYPPVTVKGGRSLKNTVTIRSDISSQFISALMLIAPVLDDGLTITLTGETISHPYIDMTYALLDECNIDLEYLEDGFAIYPSVYDITDYPIEPDWSAASYFFEISALAKGGEITIEGLTQNSIQGDSAVANLYEAIFGVTMSTKDYRRNAVLKKRHEDYTEGEYDFTDMPDMAQTVAATAAALNVEFMLTGLQTLRIKETDRIAALKTELEKLGIGLEVGKDWIKINPPLTQTGDLQFDTYNDHRMAMALAPLALIVNSVTIDNARVVNKSFPGYWDELKKLGFIITDV